MGKIWREHEFWERFRFYPSREDSRAPSHSARKGPVKGEKRMVQRREGNCREEEDEGEWEPVHNPPPHPTPPPPRGQEDGGEMQRSGGGDVLFSLLKIPMLVFRMHNN